MEGNRRGWIRGGKWRAWWRWLWKDRGWGKWI